jgi:Tfp pilus assembly protein PilE
MEMAIVVAAIAVLAAILTPIVASYVDQARIAKAQTDVRAIAEAISRFEQDVGRYPMFSSGSALLDSNANVAYLSGTASSAVTDLTSPAYWSSNAPPALCSPNTCTTSTLASQLVQNGPMYPTTSSLAKPFFWKGPYLDPEQDSLGNNFQDPWGHAYYINVINCKSTSNYACFVLSAGPNGEIETSFQISANTSFSASGDDILYRIR